MILGMRYGENGIAFVCSGLENNIYFSELKIFLKLQLDKFK